ncbi:hypothetical protein DVH24_021878 [Malus domestica]|uniref:Uncharacterized protein n=1 Tax=Malus domestica TaxID=3750 RepID=A0A498IWD5_MALDO|nr:hypothetical protein DVH24_021878 [Malus domestica]
MNENFLVHFFALYMKDGVISLTKVEEAYRHERVTKEATEEAIQSYLLYHLQDAWDAADEGADKNRLLPAVNKIWPFLVVCIRNKNPVAQLGRRRIPLQLPYRSTSISSEESLAETSNPKLQIVVLNMIAELSRNGRSASASEVILKKVSGLVVGIACSGVVGLRDASVNALQGLASIDPDLIWLLLADVYYSMKKKKHATTPHVRHA